MSPNSNSNSNNNNADLNQLQFTFTIETLVQALFDAFTMGAMASVNNPVPNPPRTTYDIARAIVCCPVCGSRGHSAYCTACTVKHLIPVFNLLVRDPLGATHVALPDAGSSNFFDVSKFAHVGLTTGSAVASSSSSSSSSAGSGAAGSLMSAPAPVASSSLSSAPAAPTPAPAATPTAPTSAAPARKQPVKTRTVKRPTTGGLRLKKLPDLQPPPDYSSALHVSSDEEDQDGSSSSASSTSNDEEEEEEEEEEEVVPPPRKKSRAAAATATTTAASRKRAPAAAASRSKPRTTRTAPKTTTRRKTVRPARAASPPPALEQDDDGTDEDDWEQVPVLEPTPTRKPRAASSPRKRQPQQQQEVATSLTRAKSTLTNYFSLDRKASTSRSKAKAPGSAAAASSSSSQDHPKQQDTAPPPPAAAEPATGNDAMQVDRIPTTMELLESDLPAMDTVEPTPAQPAPTPKSNGVTATSNGARTVTFASSLDADTPVEPMDFNDVDRLFADLSDDEEPRTTPVETAEAAAPAPAPEPVAPASSSSSSSSSGKRDEDVVTDALVMTNKKGPLPANWFMTVFKGVFIAALKHTASAGVLLLEPKALEWSDIATNVSNATMIGEQTLVLPWIDKGHAHLFVVKRAKTGEPDYKMIYYYTNPRSSYLSKDRSPESRDAFTKRLVQFGKAFVREVTGARLPSFKVEVNEVRNVKPLPNSPYDTIIRDNTMMLVLMMSIVRDVPYELFMTFENATKLLGKYLQEYLSMRANSQR